ncbi:MAG: hypothetical protein QGD90_09815 [Candidatus Hydrogenedentes bacterium]|nr:hypothetical protein [Candidatus Hydrogenedentota bacterium]
MKRLPGLPRFIHETGELRICKATLVLDGLGPKLLYRWVFKRIRSNRLAIYEVAKNPLQLVQVACDGVRRLSIL